MPVVPQLPGRKNCKLQNANFKFAISILQFAISILAIFLVGTSPVQAGPGPASYWQVDDVRPGLKGFGRTVMKGTKIETFDVAVLGVLKNSRPGRGVILW